MDGMATWKDLQSDFWSLDDVMDANAILDVKEAIQQELTPKGPK